VANEGHVYFIGNGDCYSHVDYYNHIENAKVDSVMVARGALVKPWIFEEIEKGQYLDKSASERLTYVEKFAKYGLQTWGSDELGIGTTRRFLMEWLSFAHRYVPIGLLEHLPPNIQDRPPRFHGRNDLETLMASDNYKDWTKITYVENAPSYLKQC
jgi:tRNA-dihydrouridine synthase 3